MSQAVHHFRPHESCGSNGHPSRDQLSCCVPKCGFSTTWLIHRLCRASSPTEVTIETERLFCMVQDINRWTSIDGCACVAPTSGPDIYLLGAPLLRQFSCWGTITRKNEYTSIHPLVLPFNNFSRSRLLQSVRIQLDLLDPLQREVHFPWTAPLEAMMCNGIPSHLLSAFYHHLSEVWGTLKVNRKIHLPFVYLDPK
ncbi:hypothetical protein BKA93DRAFT_387496 [Sparassis latifolia]